VAWPVVNSHTVQPIVKLGGDRNALKGKCVGHQSCHSPTATCHETTVPSVIVGDKAGIRIGRVSACGGNVPSIQWHCSTHGNESMVNQVRKVEGAGPTCPQLGTDERQCIRTLSLTRRMQRSNCSDTDPCPLQEPPPHPCNEHSGTPSSKSHLGSCTKWMLVCSLPFILLLLLA
jgi:hypothetical protein